MAHRFPYSQPDWSNVKILHRGTLPPRSYFSLYENELYAVEGHPEKSTSLLLSGIWKFYHCFNTFDVPPGFNNPSFDTSSWADIRVPSHWQLQGWPPDVRLQGNQTGVYVKRLTIPPEFANQQVRLRFEGVDAAFDVFVNGKDVGYSQGSRNPDEFDITNVANPGGQNYLAVQVYQHCDGTYLEDQDQWRMSGTFRDILLLAYPVDRIENFKAGASLDEKYRNRLLNASVWTNGQGVIHLKLLDDGGKAIAEDNRHTWPYYGKLLLHETIK